MSTQKTERLHEESLLIKKHAVFAAVIGMLNNQYNAMNLAIKFKNQGTNYDFNI